MTQMYTDRPLSSASVSICEICGSTPSILSMPSTLDSWPATEWLCAGVARATCQGSIVGDAAVAVYAIAAAILIGGGIYTVAVGIIKRHRARRLARRLERDAWTRWHAEHPPADDQGWMDGEGQRDTGTQGRSSVRRPAGRPDFTTPPPLTKGRIERIRQQWKEAHSGA